MKLKYRSGVPDSTKNYVKLILPLIGNVIEFEVFRHAEDSPYVCVEDGQEHRYTLILRDDRQNEFWLDTHCGSGGAGALATQRILQMLGLRDDYGISIPGNNYIKESNLQPAHTFDFFVGSLDHFFIEPQEHFVVRTSFPSAYQLHHAIDALKHIGHLDHYHYQLNAETSNLKVSNTLILPDSFRSFTNTQLRKVIQRVIEHNEGTVEFYEMPKTVR